MHARHSNTDPAHTHTQAVRALERRLLNILMPIRRDAFECVFVCVLALSAYQVMCERDSKCRKRKELFSFQRNVAFVYEFELNFLTVTRWPMLSLSLTLFYFSRFLCLCVNVWVCVRDRDYESWKKRRKKSSVQCTRPDDWQTDEEKSYDIFVWMCAHCWYTARPLNERTHTHTTQTFRMPSTTFMHQSECIA